MSSHITIETAIKRAQSTAERYNIPIAIVRVEGTLYIQPEDEYRPEGAELVHVAVPKLQLH